jgi:hypothetical protein
MKLKRRDSRKLRGCSGIFLHIHYFGSTVFRRGEYIVIAAEAKERSDVLKLRNAGGVPVCAGSGVVQTGRVFKKRIDAKPPVKQDRRLFLRSCLKSLDSFPGCF